MAKRAVNLSIDETLLAQARESGLNLSRFLETKLKDNAQKMRQQAWLKENNEAIKAYNARILRDGPLNQGLTRI